VIRSEWQIAATLLTQVMARAGPSRDLKVRLAAAKELLDRAYGRGTEVVKRFSTDRVAETDRVVEWMDALEKRKRLETQKARPAIRPNGELRLGNKVQSNAGGLSIPRWQAGHPDREGVLPQTRSAIPEMFNGPNLTRPTQRSLTGWGTISNAGKANSTATAAPAGGHLDDNKHSALSYISAMTNVVMFDAVGRAE
jgi:hypothetical protein